MGFYQLKTKQSFNQSNEEIWDFISDPKNLKKITPDYMGFEIKSDIPSRMYQGMVIEYRVSPLMGIKQTWVTEITHVVPLKYFVDEQRIGPYSMWHHQHMLRNEGNKTVMEDIVSYSPPFGILGSMVNQVYIKNKLKEIFDYRFKALEEIFPTHN